MIAFPCGCKAKVLIYEGSKGKISMPCPICGKFALFYPEQMTAEVSGPACGVFLLHIALLFYILNSIKYLLCSFIILHRRYFRLLSIFTGSVQSEPVSFYNQQGGCDSTREVQSSCSGDCVVRRKYMSIRARIMK